MMVADFIFYFFAMVTVLSAIGVVTARNQVHSVLFLVLAFFTTSGIFVMLGAEFLAAILIMVYMGAVAILFLFVVMMLDVDFSTLKRESVRYLPMGLMVGALILLEFVVILSHLHLKPLENPAVAVDNTLAIGRALFSTYLFPFEIASLILLVALVGAIALTHREKKRAKSQDISMQLARTREESVELKKVQTGEGA